MKRLLFGLCLAAGALTLTQAQMTQIPSAAGSTNLATGVTGTLPVANGGTGTTTGSITGTGVLAFRPGSGAQLQLQDEAGNTMINLLTAGSGVDLGAASVVIDRTSARRLKLAADSYMLTSASGDWGLGRNGAGIVEINSGTMGTIRDLRIRNVYYSSTVFDSAGTGTPEGAVTAGVGSTFRRTDGGAGTSFYVKESGTGNTGWVAK